MTHNRSLLVMHTSEKLLHYSLESITFRSALKNICTRCKTCMKVPVHIPMTNYFYINVRFCAEHGLRFFCVCALLTLVLSAESKANSIPLVISIQLYFIYFPASFTAVCRHRGRHISLDFDICEHWHFEIKNLKKFPFLLFIRDLTMS